MSSDTFTTTAQPTTGCGCGCSTCETCHSLQCLCRPRFFAGQLITDTDLRRLDEYIVGKDRMRNRYLHGTGVVGGLEVVCSACDDTVTVRPGYALGPCGEDIAVCADHRVDVGALIRAQRQARSRRTQCPPYTSEPVDCDAPEQQWILGICYDETPGRPVRTIPTATCSCGCGGAGVSRAGSGCGCGGSSSAATGAARRTTSSACGCTGTSGARPTPTAAGPTSRMPAGCEPTVICEGFRFTVTKVDPRAAREKADAPDALTAKIRRCTTMLMSRLTAAPTDTSPASLVGYAHQLKSDLRDVLVTSDVHDCTLGGRLNDVVVPAVTDNAVEERVTQALGLLLRIAVDLFRACLCSALLPPLTESCADDCVPLATLTVRSSDLRVLSVCNVASREVAVTMPMLGYYLGALPLGSTVRRLVTRLCCPASPQAGFTLDPDLRASAPVRGPVGAASGARRPASGDRPTAFAAFAATATGTDAEDADQDDVFASLPAAARIAARYLREPSPLAGLEATVLAGLGLRDGQDRPLVDQAELDSPLTALALSRVLGASGLNLGEGLRTALGAVTEAVTERPAPAAPGAPAAPDRLDDLEKKLGSLTRKVAAQAATIKKQSTVIDQLRRETDR